jgi:predicted O-methyltransferase YrrM
MWSNKILDRFRNELELITLLVEIDRKKSEFEKSISGFTYRGNPYGFAGMRPEVSTRLYGLVREFKPKTLIETGVCNGVSTAVILAALERNKAGSLYSIDFPEYTDTDYEQGTFWEGKLGAVIPKGIPPGWLIPNKYRKRWHLTLGRSQEKLPVLLNELGEIDFFLHDSEHSYECMIFEYQQAWGYLKPGGLLVSDDTSWNSAFDDFSRLNAREMNIIDRNMVFIIK